MELTENNSVGALVAQDYRVAEVFAKYKIDFCCKGGQSINAACKSKSIDPERLIQELKSVMETNSPQNINFSSWPVDLLVDYIEKKHHRYINQKTPLLQAYLKKIASVHGAAHPELLEIQELFTTSAQNLAAHMKKEELILFPYIKKLANSETTTAAHFGSVVNPIEMMKVEHNDEGERFARISELSNAYSLPTDACATYSVTYEMLKEFESDLHQHIHLENNILFPAAIRLEKK